jgi:hypothetical protein
MLMLNSIHQTALRGFKWMKELFIETKPSNGKNMPNQHISDYLNDYVDPKTKPEHAVLINGKWGSGKTWFINQCASP